MEHNRIGHGRGPVAIRDFNRFGAGVSPIAGPTLSNVRLGTTDRPTVSEVARIIGEDAGRLENDLRSAGINPVPVSDLPIDGQGVLSPRFDREQVCEFLRSKRGFPL